jgi:hypothetical protein
MTWFGEQRAPQAFPPWGCGLLPASFRHLISMHGLKHTRLQLFAMAVALFVFVVACVVSIALGPGLHTISWASICRKEAFEDMLARNSRQVNGAIPLHDA